MHKVFSLVALQIVDLLSVFVHLEGSWLRNAKLVSQVLQVIDIDLEKSNVLVLVQLVGTIPDQYCSVERSGDRLTVRT